MVDIVDKGDAETVKVYECPDCGDQFTERDADPEGTNRSPCCGKMSSVVGEGLYLEDADVVLTGDESITPADREKTFRAWIRWSGLDPSEKNEGTVARAAWEAAWHFATMDGRAVRAALKEPTAPKQPKANLSLPDPDAGIDGGKAADLPEFHDDREDPAEAG